MLMKGQDQEHIVPTKMGSATAGYVTIIFL